VRQVKCAGAGGFNGGSSLEELKDPRPVFDAGPSSLRQSVPPNASKLAEAHCKMISGMLNLG
jgi:hypothetical protein